MEEPLKFGVVLSNGSCTVDAVPGVDVTLLEGVPLFFMRRKIAVLQLVTKQVNREISLTSSVHTVDEVLCGVCG